MNIQVLSGKFVRFFYFNLQLKSLTLYSYIHHSFSLEGIIPRFVTSANLERLI